MQGLIIVLSLTLSGTLIGILITVTHPFTEKYFSRKWNYYIWLLVVIRLILPFHIVPDFIKPLNFHVDIANSTIPLTTTVSTDTLSAHDMTVQDTIDHTPIAPQNTAHDKTTLSADPLSDTQYFIFTLLPAAAYVWIFGAGIALFIKMTNYWLFKTRIKKDCQRITDNYILTLKNSFCARLHIENIPDIYKSAAVSGPMTIGLWKPMIIIPETFFAENEYVFQLVLHHELVHVARKDLWYKWIYQLLLCIHWFNPVLYQISRQINRDCELSCDEAVLSELTESGKKIYGNILLDTAAQNIGCRRNALSTTLLDNKKDLKKRLDNILHYKKINRFRLALSVCTLAVMLTFSACGTIWISSDKVSDIEDNYNDSNPFSRALASLVSSDTFMNTFSEPDQSSDTWKVYDDDALTAGEDIHDRWGAYHYSGGGKIIKASGFVLYGSDSFLIAYADRDVDVKIKSSFELSEGKFKIVYVTPDESVMTLNDTGLETTQTITMKKGRNILKYVGQGAKLKNLKIDYTDLKNSKFETVYFSEEAEYGAQVKEAVMAGKSFDKDKVINSLSYMAAKDVSDIFNALLTVQSTFTDDELCDFFIYSDCTLSSQYLLEAIRSGTIEPLSADTISQLMPYLEGECRAAVIKFLPMEEFYDVFSKNIYYLNNSEIDECLTDYINKGGIITYSMYDEISPYLNQNILKKLDLQLSTLQELP